MIFLPKFRTHCAISKKRTGNDFADLHRWIDEPTKTLGPDHRIERQHYKLLELNQIADLEIIKNKDDFTFQISLHARKKVIW